MTYVAVHCSSFTTDRKHYFIMQGGLKKRILKETSFQTFFEEMIVRQCLGKGGKKSARALCQRLLLFEVKKIKLSSVVFQGNFVLVLAS